MYSGHTDPPTSGRERVLGVFAPRGGSVADGARLAALNGIGLLAVALLLGIASIARRLLDWAFGLTIVLAMFVAGVVLVGAAMYLWYRYAVEHGRAARQSGRGTRPDVFGAVAGLPFTLVGLLLVSSGMFGLFLSMITFSLSRAVDGLQRLLFAVIFLGLAVVHIVVARAGSERH